MVTVRSPRAVSTAGAPLRLERVTKRFGEVIAVDDVSLDIASGEFLTLLGPSGSGKTTTLMMIAGFEEPSAGVIWLAEQPINTRPPYRRGFGVVFQNYALFPHMTVRENIAFPLKMHGVARSQRNDLVTRALELVRLPGYDQRFPNQLSGGQQQRVALARALVYNPPVLLMDEPLGALDKKLREEMQLEIKRIQRQLGMTAIYVTHDQEEALVMSDRIAVMNGGRIEQVDRPATLYEHPATRFVADFIGESNIISVTLVQVDGAWRGQLPGGHTVALPKASPLTADGPVNLVIRPEKVQFAADAPDLENVVDAVVHEVIYLGETTRYELRLTQGVIVSIKRQNRAGQCMFSIDDAVRVGWRTEDGSLVAAG